MSLTISRLTTIFFSLLLSFLLSPNTARAQQFVLPPTIPLAVRSPNLNCWLQYNKTFATSFGHTWPTTSNHSQTLGWTVLVRVDSLTYLFLGDVGPNLINGTVTVNSTNIMVGPSSTILRGQAGPMQVNLTFLNPIEPQDWVKQSVPFSYMSFTAKSLDSASHHVQVYSDVSGEWISGDRTQKILWNTIFDSSAIFHNVTLHTSTKYTEIFDQPEWGTLYFATLSGANVSYQSGLDTDSRGNFTRNGVLNLQQDQSHSTSNGSTVFALAYELNNITATQAPVVWSIGYTTDPAINYTDLSGAPPAPRSSYYKTRYSNDKEMMIDFLNDFSNASSRAQQLEGKIFQDSESVAPYLSSLTSLALAEVYGSMQLTVGTDRDGNLNKSDVMMFMKDIGGVKTNRVNAVETIYAAFPALMYIDPSLGAPLLESLFRLQPSRGNTYENGYAAADLGSNYPSVSGGNLNQSQGIEQTGNMLIMTYAYARASGDGSLINSYYLLLTFWADYLINSLPFIHDQSSADNLTVNNQTNLAIKGIIAIETMAQMSSVVNQTDDTNRYSSSAALLYAQWKSVALGGDQHLLAAYGQNDSWTLGYNLFADVWLNTSLVESSVYNGHSNFISNLTSNSNFSNYGMPIDNTVPTDTSVAASSWSLFVAAMTTNQDLCSGLISKVFNGTIASKATDPAFAVYYNTVNGTPFQGVGSPALGAMYAPLAVNVPAKPITVPPPGNTNLPSPRTSNIGTIVGGVIGGVAIVLAVISITAFLRRRWREAARARRRSILASSTYSREAGPAPTLTPFRPYSYEAAPQDSTIWADQGSLVTEGPDTEMVAPRHLSSAPPPQSETPVPVGLSAKGMARLRRLRAGGFNSQPSRNLEVSSPGVSQSTSSPNAVPESRGAPYNPRRLQSEVESLVRRMMERFHREEIEAPPSYTERNR